MEDDVYESEALSSYFEEKEYIANSYVMGCFNVTMVVYFACFLLNYFDVFIIDKKIMLMGFVPSVIIYIIVLAVTRKVSLSSKGIKYFILFSIVLMFTFLGITITYHVVIITSLPLLYAVLYSSKKVMWYTYALMVVSTIVTVYAGYYYGLCDANMALLTNTSLDKYLVDGQFTLITVNENPLLVLGLYFVIPRCLIYIAFGVASGGIYRLIKEGINKAKDVIKMEEFQKE